MTTQQKQGKKLTNRSRRYQALAQMVDDTRAYPVDEAIALLRQMSNTRFPETVELHLRTASDPRHSDQLVRGVAHLPHGTGKTVRVMAFVQGEGVAVAREAGADYIADDETIARISNGWTDFEAAFATPDVMGRIGRLGRVLGRRGLMPNPRTGTVVSVADLGRAIQEAKRGRLEFRMDRTALIHMGIGKITFQDEHLRQNLAAAVDAVVKAQPSGIKGRFLRSAHLTTTMSPSVQLDLNEITSLRTE